MTTKVNATTMKPLVERRTSDTTGTARQRNDIAHVFLFVVLLLVNVDFLGDRRRMRRTPDGK
jgi:hypothetical protein